MFLIESTTSTPKEALQLTQYLITNYPVTSFTKGWIKFVNRGYLKGCATGLASRHENHWVDLTVTLGFKTSRRSVKAVCHTLAHEYKHALQFDQGLYSGTTVDPVFEAEANSFATQILKELNI